MARQVVQLKIRGLDELKRALKELEETFGTAAGQRAVVNALMEPARKVANEARRLAPVGTAGISERPGALRRSIRARQGRIRTGKGGRSYRKIASVVIRPGARHAHLVEFGTAPRRQRKSFRYTGAMPAQPFMRPAWARHQHTVLQDIGPRIWEHIRRVARRNRARSVARFAAKGG